MSINIFCTQLRTVYCTAYHVTVDSDCLSDPEHSIVQIEMLFISRQDLARSHLKSLLCGHVFQGGVGAFPPQRRMGKKYMSPRHLQTKKHRGLSTRANYTDRETAAFREVSANFCG
jgi:hypothetical protein